MAVKFLRANLPASLTSGGSGSGGGLPSSTSVTINTAVLAANNVEAGTVQMAKGFTVRMVVVNAACRVRLYSTQASQAADTGVITGGVPAANRPRTTPPQLGAQHGVIMDLYLNTPDKFTWKMSPAAVGFNDDPAQTTTIYYVVDNIAGGSQAISAVLTYVPEES